MNEESIRSIIKLFSEILKTPEFLGIPQLLWSIIIPLLILLMTFIIQWYIKKRSKHNKLQINQEYIFTWTERISKSVLYQKKSYDDIIQNALNSVETNNYYMGISTIDFDKIYVITDIEYLELFVLNRNGKKESNVENYLNYFHNIKNLSNLFENSKDFYGKWYQSNFDLNKMWDNGIEKFINLYNVSVQILNNNPNDVLVQTFGKLLKSVGFFEKTLSKNQIKLNLLDPLNSFIPEYSKQFSNDNRIHLIIEAFHLCDFAY